MATRFYLPSSGTPPLAALAVDSNWELSTGLVRLPTDIIKTDTALTTTAQTWPATTTQQWVWYQYQSEPINAIDFTTADTFSIVIPGNQTTTAGDTHLAISLRVVSGDGATVRGTPFLYHATSTEFAVTTLTTRIHAARAFTANVSAQAGDRLIFEVGVHGLTPAAEQVRFRVGDPTATSDFALTAGLTTDLDSWIEISPTIDFVDLSVNSLSHANAVDNVGVVGTVLVEKFEGAGTPSGWSVGNGTPDFDYTASTLEGNQSLALFNNTLGLHRATSPYFTASSTLYSAAMFHFQSLPASANIQFFRIRGSADQSLATVGVKTTGELYIDGAGSPGTFISAGVTYYIKLKYVKGTGANGVSTLWIKGLTDSSWTQVTQNTANVGTVDAGNSCYDLPSNSGQIRLLVDHVRISTQDIDYSVILASDNLANANAIDSTVLGTSLITNALAHANALDNVGLTVSSISLITNALSHANTLDNSVLAVKLIVDNLTHANILDSSDLVQAYILVLNSLSHENSIDSALISLGIALDSLVHANVLNNLELAQKYTLSASNLDHLSSIDNTILSLAATLQLSSLAHTNSLDSLLLTQANILATNGLTHTNALGGLELEQRFDLLVDNVTHVSSIENAVLTLLLTVLDLLHGSSINNTDIVSHNILSANDLVHVNSVDNVELSRLVELIVNSLNHGNSLSNVTIEIFRVSKQFIAPNTDFIFTAPNTDFIFTASNNNFTF